jgi:hypothetical protein
VRVWIGSRASDVLSAVEIGAGGGGVEIGAAGAFGTSDARCGGGGAGAVGMLDAGASGGAGFVGVAEGRTGGGAAIAARALASSNAPDASSRAIAKAPDGRLFFRIASTSS